MNSSIPNTPPLSEDSDSVSLSHLTMDTNIGYNTQCIPYSSTHNTPFDDPIGTPYELLRPPASASPYTQSPILTKPMTHVYVVYKTYIIRSGSNATIEPPAVRSEILSVCLRADRARELAKKSWRQSFAYSIPEDKVEESDFIAFERLVCSGDGGLKNDVRGALKGGTDLWRCVNATFVDEEDGVEVMRGERAVRVARVRVDAAEGGGSEEGGGEGARTPVST